MRKSRLLGAVCALTLAMLTNAAHAAVVNPLLALNIGGTLYDVTFHDGVGDSFNALWDADGDRAFDDNDGSVFNVAPTFWNDPAGADIAAGAIIDALGADDLTTGASDSFLVPYAYSDGFVNGVWDRATQASIDAIGILRFTQGLPPGGVTHPPLASFAVVPVPAALWLFGSGLLGLIGVARRKVRS